MPVRKIQLKPGVNRENTRYTNEGGWYVSEKVRFRQGTPEKIGGWIRYSSNQFLGVCRSLWNWIALNGNNYLGVGTNKKYYIEYSGVFSDVTPIADTVSLNDPFYATSGSTTLVVADSAHGATSGDYVNFSGVTIGYGGGNVSATELNSESFELTVINADSYSIEIGTAANSVDASNSPFGDTVTAYYELAVGAETTTLAYGWGNGGWGAGNWSFGGGNTTPARLWSAYNWGEDLLFALRGGGVYYWDATLGLGERAIDITDIPGSNQAPSQVTFIYVSDISRFLLCFGANNPADSISGAFDPMLIRWADQESLTEWQPAITNQAGDLRLSHGSEIVSAVQTRQEIFTVTDSAAYSLQYVGAPLVWGAQLLGDNISIVGPNTLIFASGIVFWMGVDKFYLYSGRVQTLDCALKRYVFNDINLSQGLQTFAGTNEGFNEVWWFYCSANSTTVDRYVIFNYQENIWYYGTMARTAWSDSGLRDYPQSADYNSRILNQEYGVDDNASGTPAAIEAYIESAEFDIDDGDRFMYVYRTVPDLTFTGSTDDSDPEVVFTIYPKASSGSADGTPASGTVAAPNYPVDQYTSQIYTRFRGRQAYIKIRSNKVGTTWQLGAPRLDIRQDGRATGSGA
jgi:hypothetical protein